MACDNHSIDIDSIHNQVDANIQSLSEGWIGSTPFPCFFIEEDFAMHTLPMDFMLSEIDLCEYLNGNKYPAAMLAFCPTTYEPHSTNEEMSS